MNDWISVKDRLPKKEGHYIVVINGDFYKIPLVARYSAGRENYWRGALPHSAIEDVAYWMSIPELPKEDTDGRVD